jgi:hypothetical protein
MAKTRFPHFPECCQKILALLETEGKEGARNCEKGHAVSLEYARMVEADAARKEAEAAAAPVVVKSDAEAS